MARIFLIVVKGILVGGLIGFLSGAYVALLTKGYVLRREDYLSSILYEQTKSRFIFSMLLTFVIVFAAIGPVVAAASFGPWLRHAVFGLVGGIGTVVFCALACAAIANQQPFNMRKGSSSTYIGRARVYAIPMAFIVGPIVGIWLGRMLCLSGNPISSRQDMA